MSYQNFEPDQAKEIFINKITQLMKNIDLAKQENNFLLEMNQYDELINEYKIYINYFWEMTIQKNKTNEEIEEYKNIIIELEEYYKNLKKIKIDKFEIEQLKKEYEKLKYTTTHVKLELEENKDHNNFMKKNVC